MLGAEYGPLDLVAAAAVAVLLLYSMPIDPISRFPGFYGDGWTSRPDSHYPEDDGRVSALGLKLEVESEVLESHRSL